MATPRAGVIPTSIKDETGNIARREAEANDKLAQLFITLMAQRESRREAREFQEYMYNRRSADTDRRIEERYGGGANSDPGKLSRGGWSSTPSVVGGGGGGGSTTSSGGAAPRLPGPYDEPPSSKRFTPDAKKTSSLDTGDINVSSSARNAYAQASPQETVQPRSKTTYYPTNKAGPTLTGLPATPRKPKPQADFVNIHPSVLQAWQQSEDRWGVPRGSLLSTLGFENDGGRHDGKNGNSSARGWFQWTDGLLSEFKLKDSDRDNPIIMGEATAKNMWRNNQQLVKIAGEKYRLGNTSDDILFHTVNHLLGIGDGPLVIKAMKDNVDLPMSKVMMQNVKLKDGRIRDNGTVLAGNLIPSNASVKDFYKIQSERVMPWVNRALIYNDKRQSQGDTVQADTGTPSAGLGDAKAWLKSRAAKGTNIDGLDPHYANAMAALLQKAEQATGERAQINSGHRTYEEQARLRRNYERTGRGLAARPGQSRHEDHTGEGGRAIDVAPGGVLRYLRQNRQLVAQHGGEFLGGWAGRRDTVHIQRMRQPHPDYAQYKSGGGTQVAATPAAPQQPAEPETPAERRDVTQDFKSVPRSPALTFDDGRSRFDFSINKPQVATQQLIKPGVATAAAKPAAPQAPKPDVAQAAPAPVAPQQPAPQQAPQPAPVAPPAPAPPAAMSDQQLIDMIMPRARPDFEAQGAPSVDEGGFEQAYPPPPFEANYPEPAVPPAALTMGGGRDYSGAQSFPDSGMQLQQGAMPVAAGNEYAATPMGAQSVDEAGMRLDPGMMTAATANEYAPSVMAVPGTAEFGGDVLAAAPGNEFEVPNMAAAAGNEFAPPPKLPGANLTMPTQPFDRRERAEGMRAPREPTLPADYISPVNRAKAIFNVGQPTPSQSDIPEIPQQQEGEQVPQQSWWPPPHERYKMQNDVRNALFGKVRDAFTIDPSVHEKTAQAFQSLMPQAGDKPLPTQGAAVDVAKQAPQYASAAWDRLQAAIAAGKENLKYAGGRIADINKPRPDEVEPPRTEGFRETSDATRRVLGQIGQASADATVAAGRGIASAANAASPILQQIIAKAKEYQQRAQQPLFERTPTPAQAPAPAQQPAAAQAAPTPPPPTPPAPAQAAPQPRVSQAERPGGDRLSEKDFAPISGAQLKAVARAIYNMLPSFGGGSGGAAKPPAEQPIVPRRVPTESVMPDMSGGTMPITPQGLPTSADHIPVKKTGRQTTTTVVPNLKGGAGSGASKMPAPPQRSNAPAGGASSNKIRSVIMPDGKELFLEPGEAVPEGAKLQ